MSNVVVLSQVSRRFDSRKFVVKISPVGPAPEHQFDFRKLDTVTTTAIEVFSKRKVKNIDPGESFGRMRPRTSQNCKRADLESVEAEFMEQFHDLREIFRTQALAHRCQIELA